MFAVSQRFLVCLLCLLVLASSIPAVLAQLASKPPAAPQPEKKAEEAAPLPNYHPRRAATDEERTAISAAQAIYDDGNGTAALSAFSHFLKKYPTSDLAATAQYHIAEIYDGQGQSSKAFDAYQKLITTYPDTKEFETSVARQVLIANKYLNNSMGKIFGLQLGAGVERAQEMYESILKNAPYSKHAPIAQFNLGLAYERLGKPEKARDAYLTVADLYPTSSVADDAIYQVGYLYMRMGLSKSTADLTALATAREAFEDFLAQHPASEKISQARENITKISDLESEDIIAIARFYDKTKDYHAAAIYYNDVIRRFPRSKYAEEARNRIEYLRGDLGDDSLRTGIARADGAEQSEQRRLRARVETPALNSYAGPAAQDLVPPTPPPDADSPRTPKLRTQSRDLTPLPFSEPALPVQ